MDHGTSLDIKANRYSSTLYAFMGENPTIDVCMLAPSYLNQIKIIGQTATIIQYPAIIGVALVVWRMIADWLKENVLEYDGIYTKKQIYHLNLSLEQ